MAPYAKKRIATHIGRFTKLFDDIRINEIDEPWLKEVELRDTIFADMPCARYYLPDGKKKRAAAPPVRRGGRAGGKPRRKRRSI